MQNIIYNNINLNFTFNTIWSLLTKFWINEIINKRAYSKIWLTIIVYNSHNKSFTLINNFPFNLDCYTDILIVIKQVFNTSFFNDRDILNTIVFKYHLESKDNYKRDLYITNIFIFISIILLLILSLICIFIIYLEIYPIYNLEFMDKEILYYADENLKNTKESNNISKLFIVNYFIELFNGSTYVPSKFVDVNLNDFYVWKFLNSQGIVLDTNNTNLMKIIEELYSRLEESESLAHDLIKIISKP